MNRREFLSVTSTAGLGALASGCLVNPQQRFRSKTGNGTDPLMLLPYPQVVVQTAGSLRLGPARYTTIGKQSQTRAVATESLNRRMPSHGKSMPVRLGSVEEGYDASWITSEENEFLASEKTPREASVLTI